MDYLTIIVIAFALSLDAFSVSITCGVRLQFFVIRKYLKIALTFGLFQALMPIGGFLVGHLVRDYIFTFSAMISFFLFFFLGSAWGVF